MRRLSSMLAALTMILSLPVLAADSLPTPRVENAYLSGGCFWGMENILRRIPGVIDTEVGYTGGVTKRANYELVSSGLTGHAESVKITFDPALLSYRHLLFEFFRMHDPTTADRQGNDTGSQYRSAIFYVDRTQKDTAEEVIRTADATHQLSGRIVTEVVPYKEFHRAEDYHQDYLQKNPAGYTCHYVRRFPLGE